MSKIIQFLLRQIIEKTWFPLLFLVFSLFDHQRHKRRSPTLWNWCVQLQSSCTLTILKGIFFAEFFSSSTGPRLYWLAVLLQIRLVWKSFISNKWKTWIDRALKFVALHNCGYVERPTPFGTTVFSTNSVSSHPNSRVQLFALFFALPLPVTRVVSIGVRAAYWHWMPQQAKSIFFLFDVFDVAFGTLKSLPIGIFLGKNIFFFIFNF